jgi:hypothetical protein
MDRTTDRLERLDEEIVRRVQFEEPLEAVARDLSVTVPYAAAVAAIHVPMEV